jgi:hypothetical protein
MKPTVVILLSEKRSGSTFFERELCSSAAIQHVSYTPHTYNETHYWVMAACLLKVPKRQFSNCSVPKVYGTRAKVRKTLEKLIINNVPQFIPPENNRALVFEGWEALCDQFAQPVFFEKSPQLPHHWGAIELMLEWANNTTFDVKFIGLVRHPLAVLYSAQQLFHSKPQDRQYPWLEANHNILLMSHFVESDDFMMIRYEDIVANAGEMFEGVFRFIGLDQEPTVGASARQSSVEGWKQDAQFSVALAPAVIRLASYFGYADFECCAAESGTIRKKIKLLLNTERIVKRTLSRLYYFYNRTFR